MQAALDSSLFAQGLTRGALLFPARQNWPEESGRGTWVWCWDRLRLWRGLVSEAWGGRGDRGKRAGLPGVWQGAAAS